MVYLMFTTLSNMSENNQVLFFVLQLYEFLYEYAAKYASKQVLKG